MFPFVVAAIIAAVVVGAIIANSPKRSDLAREVHVAVFLSREAATEAARASTDSTLDRTLTISCAERTLYVLCWATPKDSWTKLTNKRFIARYPGLPDEVILLDSAEEIEPGVVMTEWRPRGPKAVATTVIQDTKGDKTSTPTEVYMVDEAGAHIVITAQAAGPTAVNGSEVYYYEWITAGLLTGGAIVDDAIGLVQASQTTGIGAPPPWLGRWELTHFDLVAGTGPQSTNLPIAMPSPMWKLPGTWDFVPVSADESGVSYWDTYRVTYWDLEVACTM